jgi:hypothetical protein
MPNIQSSIPGNFIFITVSIAIFSVLVGLGIGLIIGGISFKDSNIKKEKTTYIDNKKNTPKNPYFSKEDMPRSIKDYYKKNK